MAKKTNKKPVSAFALFGKSYQIVKKNFRNFSILLALPAISSIASAVRSHPQKGSGQPINPSNFFNGGLPAYGIVGIIGAGIIVFVLLALAALLLQAMLTSLEVQGAKGKTPTLNELWRLGKKYWLRLFGLMLVIGMYIVGASLIGALVLLILRNMLGIILGFGLIAAAVVFVLTHYYLSPYAMVDQDLPIFASMETSANLSKKKVGSVLSVLGVAILIALTAFVPYVGPVVSFVLGAIYSFAPALRYFELKKLAK
jgi:hypothetical protein